MNRMPSFNLKLLLLSALPFFFSQCSIFSNSYSYNSSRGGRPVEDRPLYEEATPPAEPEEEASDEEDSRVPPAPPVAVEGEAALRQEAVRYARTFLGTPYKLGGTSPRGGFDCSGFTSYVMDQVDVVLSRTSGMQEKDGKKVKLKDVKPGDLIFYRRSPLGKVFHVSLVVDNRADGIHVIHSTSRGVVEDNITQSSYWEPKISSARDVISQD